jgi:hypothetical protein
MGESNENYNRKPFYNKLVTLERLGLPSRLIRKPDVGME